MNAPLKSTESAALAINRVRYSHDAMIDLILAEPSITQNKIASHFGYSVGWVSRVFNSDAFQARLAERKGELIDPTITMKMEQRIEALAMQSLEVISKKLGVTEDANLALKAFELSTKAAGYGARERNVAVQNNFVVQLPNKIENAHDWAAAHRPAAVVIDIPADAVSNG
jgi:hypothetical protein